MRRSSLVTLLLLFAMAGAARGGSRCNVDSVPDAIYIDLDGCDAPPSLISFRLDGDDERLLSAVRSGNEPFWRAEPYQASMKRRTLCTRLCGLASSCAAATPSVEKEGGRTVCVARYKMRCDRQAWKLAFESVPAGTRISYTRSEASQPRLQQIGRKEAPGNVCDLGFTERGRVSIVFDDFLFPAGLFQYDMLKAAAERGVVVTPRTLLAAVTVGGRPPNDFERRLLREQVAVLPNEVKFRLEH